MGCDSEVGGARLIDSGDVTATNASEQTIATWSGDVSACDVWLKTAEAAWVESASIALYGMVGSAKTLLGRARISGSSVLHRDGVYSGLVLSVRGVPCTSLELTIAGRAAGPITGGRFFLHVFPSMPTSGSEGGPRDAAPYSAIQTLGAVAVPSREIPPVALGSSQSARGGFLVQADRHNAGPIFLGDETVEPETGIGLEPGASMFFYLRDPSMVYATATFSGATARVIVLDPAQVIS